MDVWHYLGGLGIIIAPLAFVQWLLSKWLASRLTESIKNEYAEHLEEHKGKIKKGEFVFQKKLELLGKMSEFSVTFVPIRESPDDCWSYGRGLIIVSAGDKELELRAIIAAYGYLLHGQSESLIYEIKGLLNDMKYELTGNGVEPTERGEKLVDEALDKLRDLIKLMKSEYLGNIVG
jgi:hypothetical protein